MHLRFLAFALGALTSTVHAAGEDSRRFYVGATLGAAVVAPRNFDINDDRDVDSNPSLGLFAGMHVATLPIAGGWPLFVEGGYQHINRTTAWYRTPSGETRVATEGNSVYAAARLAWPITDRFGLYTRLGVARNSAESKTVSGPQVIDVNGDKTSPLVGLGLEYQFDNGIALRGDLTSFGKSSKNADNGALNFGVSYRF
jgi:opacity protein-like surface antigen